MEHDGVTPTQRERLRVLAVRLKDLPAYLYLKWNCMDFTYQSCRFCKRVVSEGPMAAGVPGLWKYGVRHYICDDCRDDLLLGFRPTVTAGRLRDRDL